MAILAPARTSLLLLLASLTCACSLLEDNGTHLAYALERAAGELRRSGQAEMTVQVATLDGPAQPYHVEITPSLPQGGPRPELWSSYLVVSGRRSGGTSYHNRFLFVPARLRVDKPGGGPVAVLLQRHGERIELVGLR